jgi:1,4-dihydroxy-6-naphthoate synthase
VARRPLARAELAQARVAVPGEHTTANLLFRLGPPPAARRHFLPYDRIVGAVLSGEADAGVVIHESRFTVADAGLSRVADLGEWWEAETGMPLPLGCVMARRSLGERVLGDLGRLLRQCVAHARAEPEAAMPYVRRHAVELSDEVVRKHIALYVTDFSEALGETGRQALAALEQKAREAGALP